MAHWAGDQRCTPAAIERPGTRELAEIVRRATDRGLRSGLGVGPLLHRDRAHRRHHGPARAADPGTGGGPRRGPGQVEAGIVLGELNRRLDDLGLAFENLGDIDRQTLAGSISTGTHGTGARFRSVSAQVEAVEMVLADGSTLELSGAGDPAGLACARIWGRWG